MTTTPLWLLAAASSLIGGILFIAFQRWWVRWQLTRRRRHGVNAERHAGKILRQYGYRLCSEQPSSSLSMYIDGRRIRYEVRPDGLARRRRRLYAVEVKTGQTATSPTYTETRRQMLEYYHGLPVDGVLLVNADAGTVKTIAFRATAIRRNRPATLLVAFLLGVVAAMAAVQWWLA